MGKITVTTLQAGCKAYDIKTNSKKAKELESLIDEALAKLELGYECPSCKKDIPDVKVCPYCGESFEDEASDAAVDDATADDSDDSDASDASDASDTAVDDAAAEVAEKIAEKTDEKHTNKKEDKKSDKKTDKKEDTETKKQGRPAGSTVDTQKKAEEFTAFVKDVDAVVGKDVEKRDRKTGVTYVFGTKRFMKAVSSGKVLVVELNADVNSDADGLIKYTEEEAKNKHLGTVKAIYSGGDTKVALKLIKEALKNFEK